MESEGVEAAMLLAFSTELARLSPEEFARTVLAEKLHARVVIIGEDFRFGYQQSGDLATMRALGEKLGFEVESAGTIVRRGARISSTAVWRRGRYRGRAGCWGRRLRSRGRW